MTGITIRAFEESDIGSLHRVYSHQEVVRETLDAPFATLDERSKRFTSTENSRILVAELDGEPAGFGDLTRYARRRAHAARIGLAVDPSLFGRGVGSALMEALIDLGERWYGIKRFELMVFADNTRAIDLYRRFGFEVEATHRRFALRDGEHADTYSMSRLGD